MSLRSRRNFMKTVGTVGIIAAGTAAGVGLSNKSSKGQILTPTEFFGLKKVKELSRSSQPRKFFVEKTRHNQRYGYPTTYIPLELRHKNIDGSCVHLSTAVCLISIGLYQEAADWYASYRHGEFSSRHIRRLEEKGVLFAVEVNGDPSFLDFWSGNITSAGIRVAKRAMGVTFNPMHVMNLLSIDSEQTNNAAAHLLNNQGRSAEWSWTSIIAADVPREQFIRNWDRNGGWAFTILGTNEKGIRPPNPPIPYVKTGE